MLTIYKFNYFILIYKMFRFQKMKDEIIEKETITLYGLKSEKKNQFFDYDDYDEEEELDHKEENLSKNQYYKIDDKKLEELEKVFKQVKINIKLSFNLKNKSGILPEILFDIKKAEKDKNICIIYDEKFFSRITEIETSDSILFVEKLENKDIILLAFNGKDYELLVYRLLPEQKNKNNGYFLSQKIKETLEGYEQKYNYKKRYMFDVEEKTNPIKYNLFYIKAISRNRFFCVSNYGFKMYALNEKKEYELVLLEPYEQIDFIYEIDTNKFIFGLNIRRVEGYGFCGNAYTCYYNLLLNKIELKNIDEIENKKSNNDNLDNLENLKLKEKLKFSVISQTMFKSNYSSPLIYDIGIHFSDFVILKNKYFIIMIRNSILIFNMETAQEIKRFEIRVGCSQIDIKKWDCPENDEFILIARNNVYLFKLNEENSSKISLNILNYGNFPDLCIKDTKDEIIIKNLKKINSQKNRFYSYNEKTNDILIY